MKQLIFGLDGMTFDVINPLVELGHLPNIAKLMREGAHSTLLSTMPSITPVAWSSFITGKPPGDHGVYDWGIKTAGYRMSVVNANYLQDESIWSILHRTGKKIGVVGLPMTYPPYPYPSFTIAGPLSPSVHSAFTFPRTLYQEVQENVGQYIIDFDQKQLLSKGNESFVSAMTNMATARGDTALYLMQNYPWDILMPVFVATDRLQHCLWHHLDFSQPLAPLQKQIIKFYNLIDGYIGNMVAQTPEPKTVIILSDHGFGPGRRKISLNGWLMGKGYLHRNLAKGKSLREHTIALANRWGLSRAQLKKRLSQLGLLDLVETQIDRVSTYETAFDWQQSKAFAGGPGIYLNIQGREREGIVAPGTEYEHLRQEIVELLASLRDPETDDLVFEGVYKREEFYSGRRVNMAPDIIPVPKDGYKAVAQAYKEKSRRIRTDIFHNPREWNSGMHRREGILIAWGEQIEPGSVPHKPLHIWDIAPTLLSLSNTPIPTEITGRVVTELIKPLYREWTQESSGARKEFPGSKKSIWNDKDDEQLVEDRLRGLGYLE